MILTELIGSVLKKIQQILEVTLTHYVIPIQVEILEGINKFGMCFRIDFFILFIFSKSKPWEYVEFPNRR